jgi:hypothetical protein
VNDGLERQWGESVVTVRVLFWKLCKTMDILAPHQKLNFEVRKICLRNANKFTGVPKEIEVGSSVVVTALFYKPEGRRFEIR